MVIQVNTEFLQKNLRLFDVENYEIFLGDAIQFISYIRLATFDIIFADPPYGKIDYEKIKDHIEKIIKPGGVFCMEMKKQAIDTPNVRIKYYGNTQVVFWKSVI